MVHQSAIGLIGNTPLVALDRIHTRPGRILGKCDFLQPGGSIKDRAAKAILDAARSDGRLTLGGPVVEMTSGNMGAGLAVVCTALGHPFIAMMSAGNSLARAHALAGTAPVNRLLQGIKDEAGMRRGADPPADDAAGIGIDE